MAVLTQIEEYMMNDEQAERLLKALEGLQGSIANIEKHLDGIASAVAPGRVEAPYSLQVVVKDRN